MSYGNFKSVSEVARKFNIEVVNDFFVEQKAIKVIENGLMGEPDYLVAPRSKYDDMEKPAICIIAAKQEKWDEGWAQALAAMVAFALQGVDICYSVVTIGKVWEFANLHQGVFTKHPIQISATPDLQSLFNILNWLFYQVNNVYSNSMQGGNR